MPVTLQALDITVQVITRNLFREAVRVAADAYALTVCGGGQTVQVVVRELIPPYHAFIAGLPSHAADIAAILRRAAARVIVQVLRELAAADACQPVADIVAVCQFVGCATVQAFRFHPAQFVIRITCQRNFGMAVQLISIIFIYIKNYASNLLKQILILNQGCWHINML